MAKKAAGCTGATLRAYRSWIKRYQAQAGDATAALTVPAVTAFFAQLRERNLSASTIHQAYRSLKTFTRWLQAVGAIECNPLTGVNMRTPPTLPQVPTDEELCAVLEACRPTLEGIRNRALILVMAAAGLRASEIMGLLVEHWNPAERSLMVRSGKGRKDRVWFVWTHQSCTAFRVHCWKHTPYARICSSRRSSDGRGMPSRPDANEY